jgi:serine O-acetyltransferase
MPHRARATTTRAAIASGARPAEQASYLWEDCRAVVKGRRSRWFALPFGDGFATIAWYRLNRAGYLALGRGWSALRCMTAPVQPIIRLFVRSEIDYRAAIGPGLRILHPQLGVVVGGGARAGRGLILAGGNAIGDGNPVLGDHVQLGVNAVVIGNVTVGDGVIIGAGAVVVDDFAGPGVLVGVPARPLLRA